MVYTRARWLDFRPLGTAILGARANIWALAQSKAAAAESTDLEAWDLQSLFRSSCAKLSETLREVYAASACALCNKQ
jgi:hypothetical protein